jgi:integrase/recombinase XerC
MHIYHLSYQQNFFDFLQFQKRYSKNTLVSYKNDLASFFGFLQNQYPDTAICDIKTVYVRSWMADMKDNKMTARSLNRKMSSLRSFFKFLLKNQIVKSNPVNGITSPKMPKRLPQFITEKDIENLFTMIEFSEGFKGLTEKLLLKVLYFTGIRKAELIAIKENDIDKMNAQIKVLGKGSKERLIPVNNTLINDLMFYAAEKKKLGLCNENNNLFVTEKRISLDPKQVYNIVNKYLSQITTIEKKSPHILRHTFATHLMNNGAELNAVKELLGHSSLAATQIYTHNSIEKLKEVYKKAHPKG